MSFEKLLNPASVAVVGASAKPGKVGYEVLSNIINDGYTGQIYPINPKSPEILGKKCYTSLTEVPGEVDLVVIVVGRDLVIPVLEEMGRKGAKAAIIITAGFGETGEEGKKLQDEMVEIVKKHGITMVGPNCLGVLNPWNKLNASFGGAAGEPGGIALISQSGALLTAVQDIARKEQLGWSVLASIGNKASLDEVECLQGLKNDKNTKVITAYLENITRGRDFIREAEETSKEKPIVILKAGRTSAGAAAASSHTGSLAGADSTYAAAFDRVGVIRAESIEHLFDVAMAFSYMPLPKGDRVAVVTNAGGPGIMMSDAIEMNGMKIAHFDEATHKKLIETLPPAGSAHNPVDVLGDAHSEMYGKAMDIVIESPEVDSMIVVLTPQKMTDEDNVALKIVELAKKQTKPIFACFMGADRISKGIKILRDNKIPQYGVPERAAKALYEMVEYGRYKARPARKVENFKVDKKVVEEIIADYRKRGVREIGEIEAKKAMRAYGFNVPSGEFAKDAKEAGKHTEKMGYPVVMKISSPDILHKSDAGGVIVGLKNKAEVEKAFHSMMKTVKERKPDAKIDGVLLEKMIGGKDEQEVLIGMSKDPQFGPVVMFGWGGIYVEVLKDVCQKLAPLTADEAKAMIESTKVYKMLKGARGAKPSDIKAVVENLQRISQLVTDFEDIAEIDINPLKVGLEGNGATLLDARIILTKK